MRVSCAHLGSAAATPRRGKRTVSVVAIGKQMKDAQERAERTAHSDPTAAAGRMSSCSARPSTHSVQD